MDPVLNPYAPGAGRAPAALVGRDRQVEGWRVALDRLGSDRTAQPVALYGLRGVGKTVLLSGFAKAARDRGWIVAQVEAGTAASLRQGLGEALHGPLDRLARPHAGRCLLQSLRTAMTFKASYDPTGTWTFGVDLSETSGGGAASGVLETDLSRLVEDLSLAAAEEGVGLAILIDEAQDLAADELTALCGVAHLVGQRGWRCQLALAGLPSLPRVLAEAKSYAERLFDFERIQQLDPAGAREALLVPAQEEGAGWDANAVDLLVAESGGFPYFLQQFGKDTWDTAEGPIMTVLDARLGLAVGRAALDDGFFRARWDRATRSEQKYLRAMAEDGDVGSGSGEVADRLQRKPGSLGPIRARLISKGLVYAPEHGVVAFTVPGMAAFITRQCEP